MPSANLIPTIVLLLLCIKGQEVTCNDDSSLNHFPSIPKSTSSVLKETIVKSDFESQVKVLPEHQDIVFQLNYKHEIKLLFPLVKSGPISLSLSPCFGALKWTLYWRPYSTDSSSFTWLGDEKETHREARKNESSYHVKSHEVEKEKSLQHHHHQSSNHRFRPRRFLKLLEKQQRKKHLYKTSLVKQNFTTPITTNPHLRFVFRGSKPILEMEITFGGGKEPWQYTREDAKPGLYIIKVHSTSQHSKFHALASRQVDSESEDKAELSTFNAKEHSITLTWSGSNDVIQQGSLFCLSVSRQKLYSSLCAAKELSRDPGKIATTSDSSLMLGCTSNTFYTFPATSHSIYYVSVWMQGTLIPYVQAIIKAKSHHKILKLKPGVMVPFTLTAGGQAVAEFDVRKAGKKLNVAVVSCSGGVKVQVFAGKEKVASANGREALHLSVRRPPKAKLTIIVSPVPPLQSLYRVHIVASHSSRKLPVPKLPRNVTVESEILNCTAAKIHWTKSSGNPRYCIIFRRHPSGRPPEIRPPIQCGWEHVIKRPELFDVLQCFNATSDLYQERLITNLEANSSYLVNVLVRHPVTEKTLALASSMLSLPSCPQNEKNIIRPIQR